MWGRIVKEQIQIIEFQLIWICLCDPDGILTHDLQNRNLNLSIDIQVFKYLL